VAQSLRYAGEQFIGSFIKWNKLYFLLLVVATAWVRGFFADRLERCNLNLLGYWPQEKRRSADLGLFLEFLDVLVFSLDWGSLPH